MDYYTRKQNERKRALLVAQRKQLAKDILTVVVTLPLLWVFAILFLSI